MNNRLFFSSFFSYFILQGSPAGKPSMVVKIVDCGEVAIERRVPQKANKDLEPVDEPMVVETAA